VSGFDLIKKWKKKYILEKITIGYSELNLSQKIEVRSDFLHPVHDQANCDNCIYDAFTRGDFFQLNGPTGSKLHSRVQGHLWFAKDA